ncbi:MAG TPA: TonB-dependent receptor [Thermoanaerobaculia bacterium]|nr:TonB-dependent receptor [Thermoanaerobaculia bacterium]
MVRIHLRRSTWASAFLALGLLFALAGAAFAQTDVTTSRISGTVKGGDGASLPGVTVEATNQETGLKLAAVTDKDGFYRVLNLPTGTYTISAALEGFETASRKDVRLLLGSTPTVNFTLQVGKITENITVTAAVPLVEVTNTTTGTTMQSEQIAAIPVNGRNFKDLVLLTPETRLDSERGNLSISGQRGINTNVTIDGVDYNDAFFGGTVGGAEGRAPLSISQEAIKEFTVITNGASVEFGRSGGGFVNVITKSGTNSLHGSAFYYDQPQSLIADFAKVPNTPRAQTADQKKEQYGASLGGSIVKDRLFYFLSYDKQKQDVTVPISSFVLNPAVFTKYPALSSPPSYGQTRDGDVKFGRLDFQITPSQRILARVNEAKYNGVNGTSNAQTRTASYNGVEGMDSKSYIGSYSGQFGANILNDLNLNNTKEDTPRADKGLGLPEIQVGAARYGEVSFLPIVSTTKRKEAGDTLTYLLDTHIIKAGLDYNDTSIDQVFRGNWRGVFIFNNNTDFLNGKWSQYRQFGGLGGLTSTEAGRANFGQKETALFLQDQWFVHPNLTISAGLRWEGLDNPNDPVLNQNDKNPNGSFKLTAKIPDANKQFSPRFGVSWAPDSKTALRFSAGRFWSRTPAILFAQLYTSNGLRGTQYIITAPRDAAGNVLQPTDPLSPGWGGNFQVQGVERIDFTKIPTPARPGVFTIASNFNDPYTDRITLGGEREVFSHSTAGFDVTYAQGHNLQRLRDANRQYDGTIATDGLPNYSKTVFPFPYYGRITESRSDGRSRYIGITGTFNRRLTDNFSFFAAVTWSQDKDNDSNERNFAGIQAEDYNNLDLNYGYSNRDQRWKAVTSSLWQTPWWGLGLSGSLAFQTGSPYNPTVNVDVNGDGEPTTDRPTINGVHLARNSFRQPSFYSLNLRLAKDFKVGPGTLAVFAECFNCTNSGNRFVTNTIWGTGQAPAGTFGKDLGVGTPRTVQLAGRYDF